ncbi:4277_t:CDS:1, partial [Gigaspora rosea]
RRAKTEIINSVAFPKIAFNHPALAGPAVKEISSVTKLNKFAKGIIAKQLKKKMHPEGQLKI